jgi:hypothetical protein
LCTDNFEPRSEAQPAEYRARTIEANGPAFELWTQVCSLIEDVVAAPRPYESPYDIALDCLFLQAYKTSCGVYFMGIRGHEEDAATLLRRLLEVAAQAEYLAQLPDAGGRHERARLYLDHEPDEGRYWWRGTIVDLFTRIGAAATYQEDYRLLAQIAHGAARRVLPKIRDGVIQIRSVESFTVFLVFACRYVLSATRLWNDRFRLIEPDRVQRLIDASVGFHFDSPGARVR